MKLLCINSEKGRVREYSFGYVSAKSREGAANAAQEYVKQGAKLIRFDPLLGDLIGGLLMMTQELKPQTLTAPKRLVRRPNRAKVSPNLSTGVTPDDAG